MSRARLARDAAARMQIEGLLEQGRSVRSIARELGGRDHSRSAIGRYVRDYRLLAEEIAAVELLSAPATRTRPSLVDQAAMRRTTDALVRQLERRPVDRVERSLRATTTPAQRRNGASPAAIDTIRRRILGMEDP